VELTETARAMAEFLSGGDVLRLEPLGRGHINDSFRVALTSPDQFILLQRLNPQIFSDAEAVMANVVRVTRHLAARLERDGVFDFRRKAMRLVAPSADRPWTVDVEGSCWRAYEYIPGAGPVDEPSIDQLEAAAGVFGRFVAHLVDLPKPTLVRSLTGFHDTPPRLEALERAAAADIRGRVGRVRREVSKLLDRRSLSGRLVELECSCAVPLRIVHNDTKIDNVLFDFTTGDALCVVDLDTVMPGLTLHDIGDMLRSMAAITAEDEPDLSRVAVDPERFRAVLRGWMGPLAGVLNALERDHIVIAAQVITLELAARFLTDHLEGDRYFRIHRADHNLERARVQLRLLESFEDGAPLFEKLVREEWSRLT